MRLFFVWGYGLLCHAGTLYGYHVTAACDDRRMSRRSGGHPLGYGRLRLPDGEEKAKTGMTVAGGEFEGAVMVACDGAGEAEAYSQT